MSEIGKSLMTDKSGQHSALSVFETYPNLFAKQTRRGCFQEMCGCEAETEFNIATIEKPKDDIFHADEESSCCIRCCCPTHRPFTMNVTKMGEQDVIVSYRRPCSCMLSCGKCCCYQQMITHDPDGQEIGKTTEMCWICVPGFKVLDKNGEVKYKMNQPTCCCGCCVNFCAEGCCNCRIPFYIYNPDGGDEVGKIVKVWSGFTSELFTDADKFQIEFPEGCSGEDRANLLGSLFLINMLFFESTKEKPDN